jgi:iron(III) transport system substrate-binding protein
MTLCLVAAGCGRDVPDATERPPAPPVVVYAARDADTMRAVLDKYTDETGITVLLTTESGRSLVDRIIAEKHRATADLLLADSIGHFWRAAEADVIRPSSLESLEINIPVRLRDPDKLWFALLAFARTIAYDTRKIDSNELSDYAALGDDRWRGELCLTSAADIDVQSHIAMMIRDLGERATELAVRAWVANLATPIVRDDAQLLQAIEDGRCSLGIVNTDDLARFARDQPMTAVAGYLPPASSGGSYISIVGAAVTRHANNPAGALRLLEWLSSDKGQELLAREDLEVPIGDLDEWSALQISPIDLAGVAYYYEDVVRLMERARYGRAQ